MEKRRPEGNLTPVLRIESFINDKSDAIVSDLLRTFLDFDYETVTNPYVKALAPLVLSSARIRGDFQLITKLLSAITNCNVSYNKYALTVKFIVHKRGLNQLEYQNFNAELKQLFELVEDWFVPMQYTVEYMIKDYKQRPVLSSEKPLLLNYNTNL